MLGGAAIATQMPKAQPTVVVSDACCLIDMHKGQLLQAMMKLPFHFLVPFTVRAFEVLTFTDKEWQILDDGGLETHDMPPDGVADASRLQNERPSLSFNDAMCLVTTTRFDGAILLTGDKTLRKTAKAKDVEVHGVLWLWDELRAAGLASATLLRAAALTWRADPNVRLADHDIERYLSRL